MNLTTFAFILSGVLLNACAQLFLKAGTNAMGGAIHLTAQNALPTFLKVVSQLPILAGLACYGVSLVVWIVGLSRTDVTIAYPMLSLGYVVSALGAWMFLGEVIPPQRLLAIGLIMLGVILLART
ncbi:4-amino-4-deoxy-L-arabinose transferase [Massilia sp. YIM B02763]|uniref:4-amino-4-deoxy-L-arabinose transferase n=1 Tax=Massilia sp. YIM B02763 TaxID=3050130 RepID=UPI0025B6DA91|nr:4-amino-4-deoxy-L-arabinose transferase [Massilia sp. YIM B02763]MDN4052862.1 4-amino-4-deoxy-L-arabinose transferase [Massilia sp. YIM B02763]